MKQNIQEMFLDTFDKKNKTTYKEFRKAEPLIKQKITIGQINKITDVNYNSLSNWARKTPSVPNSVRCFEKARKRGYFRLPKNQLETVSYLIGYIFGDGSISKDKCKVWFYGIYTDMPEINKMLEKFKVSGVTRLYENNHGKMAVCDNAFTRLLVALGAPIGDKTKQSSNIPEWIILSDKNTKVNFLQGIFDSELNYLQKHKKRRLCFQSLKFYTSREITQIEGGIHFLNQIRGLLSEFDITTTDVKKDRIYSRKDGTKAIQLYFIIHSNYINLHKFICHIGFLTNTKRRESILMHSKNIENIAKIESEKIEKYKQCIEMRKEGLSAYKIAYTLDMPTHLVKSWLYKNRKPRLFNSI